MKITEARTRVVEWRGETVPPRLLSAPMQWTCFSFPKTRCPLSDFIAG